MLETLDRHPWVWVGAIGHADRSQAVRLYRRFYQDARPEWADMFADAVPPGTSMATLQGYLLARGDHPCLAVAQTDELSPESPEPLQLAPAVA